MELTEEQRKLLKDLMVVSAQKGNLANSGLVLVEGNVLATAESWVVSSCDATAHSERMLVELVGRLQHSNYTPGLVMVSVVEPCVMCLSAASQAGYTELAYIIPASRYAARLPWMTDGIKIDKQSLSQQFSSPIKLSHLADYEQEFCTVFEDAMKSMLG